MPTVTQIRKNFPVFYGTHQLIIVVTKAHHFSLSWSISLQSRPFPILLL